MYLLGGPPVSQPTTQPAARGRSQSVRGCTKSRCTVYGLTATLRGTGSFPSLQKKRQRVQELPCLRSLSKQVADR